ncbi:nitrogen fixation protein NifQ [Denitromonas iodatirespirans]|uniref:Nitrogen fixation protein NifQ n=1 Tax=Denitromonas iodatirespirans TaxID=2795389 RepID=A0A944HBR3_DENI1|nr:nitrogen fixation protein NifQ [Denitromonas iodatirespirans]MBT0960521.1 nitrogen fixation protein NifQ [Denitromonas iodatirespirans]
MNATDPIAMRANLHAELLRRPVDTAVAQDPNRRVFASMVAGQSAGFGCLPADLGLGTVAFVRMLNHFFPGPVPRTLGREVEDIPEWEDLQKLLLTHRANQHRAELWMADIVATACAGRDHLWQDLGLADRGELSLLLTHNFPALAGQNSGDMKWKKFLYRQFCAAEGIYVCPAPSCGECADYAKCFGPEA